MTYHEKRVGKRIIYGWLHIGCKHFWELGPFVREVK